MFAILREITWQHLKSLTKCSNLAHLEVQNLYQYFFVHINNNNRQADSSISAPKLNTTNWLSAHGEQQGFLTTKYSIASAIISSSHHVIHLNVLHHQKIHQSSIREIQLIDRNIYYGY